MRIRSVTVALALLAACTDPGRAPADSDAGILCASDSQCPSGQLCGSDGVCQGARCTSNSDCPAGQICDATLRCEVPPDAGYVYIGADAGSWAGWDGGWCCPDGGEGFCCPDDRPWLCLQQVTSGLITYCAMSEQETAGDGCTPDPVNPEQHAPVTCN